MAIARAWSFSVELFRLGVLGPFRAGRVVRGLHFFAVRLAGDALIRFAAAPWEFPDPPATEAEFQAIDRSFFRGSQSGVVPDPYVVVPTGADIYLPLQVRFDKIHYIAFEVLTMDALGSYSGAVCSACGLGSVRSAKRRGRTIQVFA